jgi:hypothetical protein
MLGFVFWIGGMIAKPVLVPETKSVGDPGVVGVSSPSEPEAEAGHGLDSGLQPLPGT